MAHLGIVYPADLVQQLATAHVGGEVPSVGREEDNAERGINVRDEAATPTFWRFAGHGVREENGPAEVEGRGEAEDFLAVASRGGQSVRTVPLADDTCHGSSVHRDEDTQPHGPMERRCEGAEDAIGGEMLLP